MNNLIKMIHVFIISNLLLGEKVGEGHMCLWCGEKSKMFHSVQAVQKHMVDKGHCKILFEKESALEFADFYDYR